MDKALIWDLPIRIFHWGFAICITSALAIGLSVDDDNPLFLYHALFGLSAIFLLIIRFFIGLFGSRHTKLSALFFSPKEIVSYFLGVISGSAKKYSGHNPANAVVVLCMFFLTASLVFTGISMENEVFEEIHEAFAFVFIGVIITHLLGILMHTLRYKENIAFSMISGRKSITDDTGIKKQNSVAGLVILVLFAYWIISLFNNIDTRSSSVTIPIIGKTISIGENESSEHESMPHDTKKGSKPSQEEKEENDDD